MPISYQDVINEGILDELAAVFQNPVNAGVLLAAIGFPRTRIPNFPEGGDALNFWTRVCELINNGVFEGGFDALIEAAAKRYPYNPVFARYRTPEVEVPPQGAVSILVMGWSDPQDLINTARTLAQQQGMNPDTVNLGFANIEGVLLSLTDWTPDQALSLAKALAENSANTANPARTTVSTSPFTDYLISRLLIEGPDQARFEIGNIRASTKVGDIARGVIGTQYDPGMFGSGTTGAGRNAVVDHVNKDGTNERCDPDKTLHESNIRDGDTLHVSPESTAGSINPVTREEALARARSQIVTYAESHPGFQVDANARRIPTEYIFRFQAPSWAPPPVPGGDPVEIETHEVFLFLPADFPMQAPGVYWRTPIFHPNVDPKDGEVCLGALGEHYRPGLDFGELCQMLLDIATYQNYAVEEGYNLEAQKWALSKDGQVAIEKRGGKSTIRKMIKQIITPRPLQIKRVDK